MDSNMSSTTSWYYQGEDGKVYGPASSEDMMSWFRAGYFDPHVLLGTDKEVRFYRLSDWILACGQVPFLLPIKSMESTIMQRMNSVYNVISSQGQTCMSPVMLIPQNGLVRQQMPPGLPIPLPVFFPPPLSNDPADDGGRSTTSQTPDSENWQAPESTMRRASESALIDKDSDTSDAPWLSHKNNNKDADVQTTISTSSIAIQTEPIQISALEACEALSQLLGARVVIT